MTFSKLEASLQKMVAKMKSIECADELYNSFGQEYAIKSKTNLLSCNPINDNVFVPSSLTN